MKIIGNVLHTEHLAITFHRTLRVPEQGGTNKLPPNLGYFPLRRVDDYKDTVPKAWLEKGGIILPLFQREALWMSFAKKTHLPCAVKVATGKVNAITGERWKDGLSASPQDYMACPPQPWLDGVKTGGGKVKQFVAMPLGQGYSVEKQVTGEESHGGIQLAIYSGKADRFPEPVNKEYASGGFGGFNDKFAPPGVYANQIHEGVQICNTTHDHTTMSVEYSSNTIQEMSGEEARAKRPGMYREMVGEGDHRLGGPLRRKARRNRGASGQSVKAAAMSMAAGGEIEQKIYPDPHGIDAWDQTTKERVFVHLVNSQMWREITGEEPPATPITRQTYIQYGYPWYDLLDEKLGDVGTASNLSGLKSISQIDQDKGFTAPQQDDTPIEVEKIISQKPPAIAVDKNAIRDGAW